MPRARALALLLGVGALTAVTAQPPPPEPTVVDVETIAGNLVLLKGGGGNTAVFVTGSGVVVVDTKMPGWGRLIIDQVNELKK